MYPVDSCWHPLPSPGAIQWWYFTLLCDDGLILRGRLWVRGNPAAGLRCGVELSGYPAGGEPFEKARIFGQDAFYAERHRPLVMVESSTLEREGPRILLDLRLPDLTLHAEAESAVLPGENMVREHTVTGQGFTWTVPMLKGAFRGTLTRGAGARRRAQAVTGTMFHDHVCTDVSPTLDWVLNYRGWCWGVAYTAERSRLLLDVDYARAPVRYLFEARDGGAVAVRRAQPGREFSVRYSDPPVFALGPRAEREVRLHRVYRKRHLIPGHPLAERLTNLLPGLRKHHGAGEIDGGSFYFEMLRLRG